MGVKRGPDGQFIEDGETTGSAGRTGGPTTGSRRSYDEPTLKPGQRISRRPADSTAYDGERTMRPGQKIEATGPVDFEPEDDLPLPVGWLVVVEGPGAGEVLTLYTGHNIVGRGGRSHLLLDFGDGGVSETQFNVLYEPTSQQFHIERMPGAAETYIDKTPLRALAELQRGARIKASQTVLRFAPFCDADFSWPIPGDGA